MGFAQTAVFELSDWKLTEYALTITVSATAPVRMRETFTRSLHSDDPKTNEWRHALGSHYHGHGGIRDPGQRVLNDLVAGNEMLSVVVRAALGEWEARRVARRRGGVAHD